MTEEEYTIIDSPLSREITMYGITIQVHIFRGEHDDGWILEVVDRSGASTVWDDRFAADQAALDEVLRTIEVEGIGTFLETSAGKLLH
jgi:hypothetical protein